MGSRKHFFSIEHQERNGQVSTFNYEGVIRVMERSVDLERFRANYHVLRGAVPQDPGDGDVPARFGCARGKLCALCTTRPDCGGGPPPRTGQLARASSAQRAIAARVAPGQRTILVKRTVEIATLKGGQEYLFDPAGEPSVRIPIFDPPAGDDVGKLALSLAAYREAAQIKSQSLAFHLYLITSAPKSLPKELPLAGKLIAVPVFRGRSAARGKPSSRLLAA